MTFADIITTEDQYEVAKARATISFYTQLAATFVRHINLFFAVRWGEVNGSA